MSVYRYVATCIAVVEIEAASHAEAEATIRDCINGADEANLGSWPNGDPILASLCVEGELDLDSIDGEAA